MSSPRINTIVFYHGNCADGFSGAWAAHKKLGDRARYIGLGHNDQPPTNIKGKKLYFIDFVFAKSVMANIINENDVTILDHHESVRDVIESVPDHLYGVDNSGAVLAWKYFFPKKRTPKLLLYVEDMDLWKWKLPNAREIAAYIEINNFDFKSWDILARKLEDGKTRKDIVKQGKALMLYEDRLADRLVHGHSELVLFEGKKVLAVNTHAVHSLVGALLIKKRPPFSITWCKMGDHFKVSLRSVRNFDVSKIAKKYGGGGHKNAAGFTIPADKKFPWTPVKPKKGHKH